MAVRTPLSTTTSRAPFSMTFLTGSAWGSPSHVDAAVDVDLLSRDVVAIGGHEHDDLRDLIRLAEPPHGDSGLDLLLDLGRDLRQHVGEREARRDGVDG